MFKIKSECVIGTFGRLKSCCHSDTKPEPQALYAETRLQLAPRTGLLYHQGQMDSPTARTGYRKGPPSKHCEPESVPVMVLRKEHGKILGFAQF